MMRLGIFGPPGSGKGTICNTLVQQYNIVHLATGDIFRRIINSNSALGQKVYTIITQGNYVPDSITIDVIKEYLMDNAIQKQGYILDGFPRTLTQAQWLLKHVSLDVFLILEINHNTIIQRIAGRRIHPGSGRVYHIVNNPPKITGKDDITGETLIQREDDTVEKIQHRLAIYKEKSKETLPLLKSQINCVHINASTDKEDMIAQCINIIETNINK